MIDYLGAVLNVALDHGIGIECTSELSPDTPSVASPETRCMIVNLNWHDPQQLPYQAAHEIAHILNQDAGALYLFSLSRISIEGAANRGAINILVPIYFDGIDGHDANVERFMEAFQIPGTMWDWCEEAINDHYHCAGK